MEELSRRSFPSENIETPNDTRDQNQNDRVEEPPNPPSRNQSIRNLGYIFRQRTPDDFNFEDLTSDFYRINNDDEETVVVEGKDELTLMICDTSQNQSFNGFCFQKILMIGQMKRMNLHQAFEKYLDTMMHHQAFSLDIPHIGKDFRGHQVEASQDGGHPGRYELVIHRQH